MYSFSHLLIFLLSIHTRLFHVAATPVSPIANTQLLTLPSDSQPIRNSSSTNNTLTAPTQYVVPGTQIGMNIRFGFPKQTLNHYTLGKLLATAHEVLKVECQTFGYNTMIPRKGDQLKAYYYSVGFLELQVDHAPTRTLKWGELKDIVRGLGLFLYVGERPYRTLFDAGSGYTKIGEGFVRQVGVGVQ